MENNILVNMYQHSDFLIIFIVLFLLLISVVVWAFFLSKFLFLIRSRRLLERDLSLLKRVFNVEEAISSLMVPRYFLSFPLTSLLKDIIFELYWTWYMSSCMSLSNSSSIDIKDSIKSRIVMCLERRVVNIRNFMEKGNVFLSTVASVSPFIGLFGTIWSIIKYFINLSSVQFMNFSIISSGISEALVLTGIGLFVSIPALIMHNVFLYCIVIYENIVDDCMAHLVLLIVRDLDAEVRVSHHILLSAYQQFSINKVKKRTD